MEKQAITEKEKIAFENGYRAACLEYGIPFTEVTITPFETVRICVEHTLDTFRGSYLEKNANAAAICIQKTLIDKLRRLGFEKINKNISNK